ncbi:hypothetical protein [uncultured Pseudacidovorax sp.]|uniref:hypothetical protein n=1 Tax=uncultured Pseudacidovorax sp. TaxID=679313 RepID=UPI0025E4784D|nr:hypothetical protein [uncultured Pseudacidovorax sp.]
MTSARHPTNTAWANKMQREIFELLDAAGTVEPNPVTLSLQQEARAVALTRAAIDRAADAARPIPAVTAACESSQPAGALPSAAPAGSAVRRLLRQWLRGLRASRFS